MDSALEVAHHSCEPTGSGFPGGTATSGCANSHLRREQFAGAVVGRGVAQLGERAVLDLADALPRQLEHLTDLVEGARLAAVEAVAQLEDLALAVVERREELLDLLAHQLLEHRVER